MKIRVIGFNFTKISIEKINEINLEKLEISNNINISEIKKTDSNLLNTKDEIIAIKFTYSINYDPDFAKIDFSGNILFEVDSKYSEEILKEWEDKKIKEDFKLNLFNMIMRKSNIRAINLEDELNLPIHIKLPSLQKQEETEENNKEEKKE
jgi:hypothetical protein